MSTPIQKNTDVLFSLRSKQEKSLNALKTQTLWRPWILIFFPRAIGSFWPSYPPPYPHVLPHHAWNDCLSTAVICVLPEGALVSGDTDRIRAPSFRPLPAGVCKGWVLSRLLPNHPTPTPTPLYLQYPQTVPARVMLMTLNWSFPSHQQAVNYILACSAVASSWVTAKDYTN